MSKEAKKKIRENFRNECFAREKYSCAMCAFKSTAEKTLNELDCHHITSRTEMPNGGYVKENGISLCENCHVKAERCYYSDDNKEFADFSPENLYKKINSNKEKAIFASNKLLMKGN